MSKANTEISTKELENRELLYCLYYDIMDEIKDLIRHFIIVEKELDKKYNLNWISWS